MVDTLRNQILKKKKTGENLCKLDIMKTKKKKGCFQIFKNACPTRKVK